jgi:hypothetical protein
MRSHTLSQDLSEGAIGGGMTRWLIQPCTREQTGGMETLGVTVDNARDGPCDS